MSPARHRGNGPIDWAAVRLRLSRAQIATDAEFSLPPGETHALLEARARALARPLIDPTAHGEMVELAVFVLGKEHYAIESRYVREVVRLEEYTPVPGTPDFVVGVINLRGEIVAVIDLRRFLGLVPKGVTDLCRAFILGHERPEFGILADRAEELVTIAAADILSPPEAGDAVAREYLRGVTRDALIVLHGGVLLTDTRLFVDQGEALASSRSNS